jgi:hypothetical protein
MCRHASSNGLHFSSGFLKDKIIQEQEQEQEQEHEQEQEQEQEQGKARQNRARQTRQDSHKAR